MLLQMYADAFKDYSGRVRASYSDSGEVETDDQARFLDDYGCKKQIVADVTQALQQLLLVSCTIRTN